MTKPITTAALVSLNACVDVQLDADEPSGPAKFGGVAYSGGAVSRLTAKPTLPHDYVIDLAGMKPSRNVVANLDHKPTQRVGHVADIANDGQQLRITGLLSAATAYRDEVQNSARDGFRWEGSIEGSLTNPELVPAGKVAVVNGQQVAGPKLVFRKSTFTGYAFVGEGADEGQYVNIAAEKPQEPLPMNEFDQFVVSCGHDPATLDASVRANLQGLFDLKSRSSATPEKLTFEQQAVRVEAEQKRRETIQSAALEAMRDYPAHSADVRALCEAALDDSSVDVRDFQLQLMRLTRGTAGQYAKKSRAAADKLMVEAALAKAVGLDIEHDRSYGAQVAEAVDRDDELRNFTLQQMLLTVAEQNGYSARRGARITNGNIREVLEHCFPPVSARLGGVSTVSLPGILQAVANKQILAGYMEEDNTWKEFATVRNVTNFYQHTHYRMLDDLEYEQLGSGGEIKHGTLGQESFTSQARTYGKMLGLTREQVINDDLGVFDDLRSRLGRGAAKKFNNVFWGAFIDNSTFFTTALTNYIEGSTSNLGIDGVGLELGVTALRTMTTPTADGSKRVGAGVRATKLLIPPELEFIAERLYQSSNVNTGGSSTAERVPNANIHAGKYRPVVQWRLSNSAYTGYSATAWYLFGSDAYPMMVSFLNGQQTPTVESTSADFGTLGILFRGYHDFGCDRAEYLAGIKSKGAA